MRREDADECVIRSDVGTKIWTSDDLEAETDRSLALYVGRLPVRMVDAVKRRREGIP